MYVLRTRSGNGHHKNIEKVMAKNNIECPFPNVEISLRIFLTLKATNYSAELLFSQLKLLEYPKIATMRQEKLDSISLQMIEADMLRKINLDDILKDITRHKSGKGTLRCKCMSSFIYEGVLLIIITSR